MIRKYLNDEKVSIMFIKKLGAFFFISLGIAGCVTGREADNAESAQYTGMRYLLGRGVKQDNEKAFYYFSKAAKYDDPFAENELAYMYAAGKGTPQNDHKAFEWYLKAANHGLASAQYNLGMLYETGLGTPQNVFLAEAWYRKSAALGFEPAKSALARFNDA